MPSFRIAISPSRRVAGRFVASVRRAVQQALVEENLTQSDIARTLGVHRSVISREIRGYKDITLGRVAELAFALGRKPSFALEKPQVSEGANNVPPQVETAAPVVINVYSSSAVETKIESAIQGNITVRSRVA
jgi:transcriptional regulator with XRE-family HTH domain